MKSVALCAIASLLLSFSCNTTDPPPGEQPVSFSAIDASCVEVWLEIKFHPDAHPRTIEIKRDTVPVLTTTLTGTDTLIVDEGLLPNRSYTYTLTRPGVWQDRPLTATITTMDSSSSNWVFDEPVLLGDGSSSVLYDVAIINDTLAYAVGEIYKRDSLGNWDPLPYNLVKWDGNTWELKRVTVTHRGSPITPPLNAIFAFSATDIWLSSGVPIHGNGINWTQYHLFDMGILTQNDGSINKIWGSASDLWFVGNRGTIVHRSTSGTWRRMESGTNLPINDIFGSINRTTGEWEVLCIASNQFINEGRTFLQIKNTGVIQLPDSGLSWALNTVWHVAARRYFIGGDGLYQSRWLGPAWSRDTSFPPYYKTSVRGTGLNDIAIAGAFGLFMYYNGATWRNFHNQTFMSSGAFGRVSIKGNVVVAVGATGGRAVVLVGRR